MDTRRNLRYHSNGDFMVSQDREKRHAPMIQLYLSYKTLNIVDSRRDPVESCFIEQRKIVKVE